MFLWWWRVGRAPLLPCGKFTQGEGEQGKGKGSALCKPISSCGALKFCLWLVQAILGLSNYSWVQLFKGTLAVRHSNSMISHDLWTSCSSSARCACLLFSAGVGTHPCWSCPTQKECAEETALGKGNRVLWEWQSPWVQLGCLSSLYSLYRYRAVSALYKL